MEIAALDALAETPPRSVAGLLAALDYLRPYANESASAAKALDRLIHTAVENAGLLSTAS